MEASSSSSKMELLRGLYSDTLSTAAEDILAEVERTVAGYEEEAAALRQEVERMRRQLEAVLQPRVKLERIDDHFLVCEPPAGGGRGGGAEEEEEYKYELNNQNPVCEETAAGGGGGGGGAELPEEEEEQQYEPESESEDEDLIHPDDDLSEDGGDCHVRDPTYVFDKTEDDNDEEDYGDYIPRPYPMKRRRGLFATSRDIEEEEEEEDRWHNKEEKDKIPELLKFMPTRDPGLALDITAQWSSLSLFQLFFSSSVVQTVVANTNKNAAKRLQTGLKFNWKPLTVSDFYTLLAIIVYSGLVRVHCRSDYWRKDWPYNFRFPGDTMKRERFETILYCLHLSDPAEDEANDRKKNTAEYDRLFKIKPLYTQMVSACKEHFQPYQNITIDERTVPSKARLRWAHKIFVLADSSTGYMWNFLVYDGMNVHIPGQGLCYTSVMDLMALPVLGQGYTLFINSFYSSPALFKKLSSGACGPIRKKRLGFPQIKKNDLPKDAERGDIRWIRHNNLLFVKWMDTQEVTMCSTVHEAFSGRTTKRRVKEDGVWQTKSMTIPDSVLEYNQNMGGVDLSDALIGYYSVRHKSMKWYKTFFFHFIDIAVVNSFLLHKELFKKKADPAVTKPFTQKRFRETLVSEMLWFATGSAPHQPAAETSCMPAYHESDASDDRMYCKKCHDAGLKRVKTPVYCTKCKFSLCLTSQRNCFRDWHEKHK